MIWAWKLWMRLGRDAAIFHRMQNKTLHFKIAHARYACLCFFVGLRFIFEWNICKKLSGDFCGTNNRRLCDASVFSLFGKTKGFICFLFNNRSQKAPPSFLHTWMFHLKTKSKPAKKMQGCDLLLNWRPHAKIQLIWEKKQTRIQQSMVMLRRLHL